MKPFYILFAIMMFRPTLGFSQNEDFNYTSRTETVDEITDKAALYLEGQLHVCRLIDNFKFAPYFWSYVKQLMRERPEVTFYKLEESLRRHNTSLYLIAIPKNLVELNFNGQNHCLIYPNSTITDPEPEYLAHLEIGDSESALFFMQRYGTLNHKENLQNLKKAGILESCELMEKGENNIQNRDRVPQC